MVVMAQSHPFSGVPDCPTAGHFPPAVFLLQQRWILPQSGDVWFFS